MSRRLSVLREDDGQDPRHHDGCRQAPTGEHGDLPGPPKQHDGEAHQADRARDDDADAGHREPAVTLHVARR